MKKLCKHPIESLRTRNETKYNEDEYGTSCATITYFLTCFECSKSIEVDCSGVMYHRYETFTGRDLGFSELKSIFKKNPTLFHRIEGIDQKLKKEVMCNPKLEKALADKQKSIKKLQVDYYKLLKKYRGGVLDDWDDSKLKELDGTFDKIYKTLNLR